MSSWIGLLIAIAITLFIFKRSWFNLFTRKTLSVMKLVFVKVFMTLAWLFVRIGYWILWLIWEFILFVGRAFGALFQMLFSR